ncbi:MAG: ankyrin repeat domain-containing protein [Wolbachia pipientis]
MDKELDEIFNSISKIAKSLLYGVHLSEKEIDLFEALSNKDLDQTKILLEQVQDINAQTIDGGMVPGKSILHYIVKNSCNNPKSGWTELLEGVLSKYGVNLIDLNVISALEGAPLNLACELGDLDIVNILLKYGAEPDARILYCVLMDNKNDVAKVLLEHGAKIDADPKVEKLIIDSITKYSRSTVEMLLPYMSNRQKSRMLKSIDYSDHEKTDHNIELKELLLEAGADPEFCDKTERRWIIIVPALLFGAIGATLATMGIIPEITAIGVIATAVLSGIAGAVIGGIAGCLVDIAINQCCGNQQCAVQ